MMSPRSQRPRPPQARRRLGAQERRERIRAGAMEVFAEHGYEGASMAEIATAAEVTAAVIYDHFPSKAALHIGLLEQQTSELIAAVGSALAAAGDAPEERMRVGTDAFFAFVEQHPFAWRLIFRDPPSDPEVAAAHRRINDQATAAIAGFIEQSSGRAETAELFAEMLKMSYRALAMWWYEHRDVPREQVVERLLDFCWVGMRNMPAR